MQHSPSVLRTRRPWWRLAAGATALATTAFIGTVGVNADATAQLTAAVPDPGRIVSPVPAAFTPQFNGTVYAITQVGDTMVVGGKFTSATQGGTTYPRTNIIAFSATTGAVVAGFNPQLDSSVQAVQPGPTAGTVYVGGGFTGRLTLLTISTGQPVTGFTKPTIASGIVNDLDVVGNRLYLGGTFTKVAGVQHLGFATLNATTGALDPFANLNFTGHHNWTPASPTGDAKAPTGISEFAISPDGTILVAIGNFTAVSGSARDQVVKIDLTGATAAVQASWSTSRFQPACFSGAFDSYIRDVNFSPAGSYFAIVATGGPSRPTLCDTASRWETSATGSDVQPTWIDDAGGDTLYSTVATNDAVYIGGHQRWLNNASGADYAGAGAVPRPGLGAVDPLNGVPLAWNPGRNPRGVAVYNMYVGKAGLWIGYNTDYIGNHRYKRMKLAFFPTAGGEVAPGGVTPALPGNLYLGGSQPGANSHILYRVNTGGSTVGAVDNGPDWAPDRGTERSPYRNGGSNDADWGGLPFTRGADLPSTTPTAVFSTERWSPNDNPNMQWDFPAPSGDQLQVRLFFANGCSCTEFAGQRSFNVSLDGTPVLTNYDIVADVGDQVATMKQFAITSDGNVDIDFSHVVENPLVNAIEIVDTSLPVPPTTDAGLRYRDVTGTAFGPELDAPDGGIDWSTVRGAVEIDSMLYYARTDGMLYRRTFDGSAYGPERAVNPYTNDPVWKNVDTGSGQTYNGVLPDFYNELSSLTGITFRGGKLYYTRTGDTTLYYRGFSPESGIVSPQEFTVSGVTLTDIGGLVLSGSDLYTVSKSTGDLSVRDWNGGSPGTASTVVSGPSSDGIDWRARSLFVGP